jgi:hypothetical protein
MKFKKNLFEICLVFLYIGTALSNKEKNCKSKILTSFGLQSEITPNNSNALCPAIKLNCCTKMDQLKIHKIYKDHTHENLNKYYESAIHKFSEFVTKMVAKKDEINLQSVVDAFQKKDPPSSEDLLSHLSALKAKYDKNNSHHYLEIANPLTHTLKSYFHSISHLRKAFLCNICNWENHEFINPETMTITYHQDFCDSLIEKNLEMWNHKYVQLFEFIYILDEFLYITANFRLIENSLDREIFLHYNKVIKGCESNREDEETCEILCKEFNINKFTFLIDGEVQELEKIVKQFEIAHGILADNAQRKLFLDLKGRNSERRLQEIVLPIVDQNVEVITEASTNLQYTNVNVTEYSETVNLTDQVNIKTLDDENSPYNLYKIIDEPIELSKFKIEIEEDFGFDPHTDLKDINLELPLEKLINVLFASASSHGIKTQVNDDVKNIVSEYTIEDITEFVTDTTLDYKNINTHAEREKALLELEHNLETEKIRARKLKGFSSILNVFVAFVFLFLK